MPKRNINIEDEGNPPMVIPDGYYLLEDTILIKAKGYPGVIECYGSGVLKNWWYDEECNFNGKLTLKDERVGYMYPPLHPSNDRVPEVEDLRKYASSGRKLKDLDPNNPQDSINKVRYSQISNLIESKRAQIAQLNEDIESLTCKLKLYS